LQVKPVPLANLPLAQAVHDVWSVAILPAVHSMQAVWPTGLILPTGHPKHAVRSAAVPYFPASHCVHEVLAEVGLYWPAAQDTQEQLVLVYFPAWQATHSLDSSTEWKPLGQLVAALAPAAENVPHKLTAQTADPATVLCLPRGQGAHALPAVENSPAAQRTQPHAPELLLQPAAHVLQELLETTSWNSPELHGAQCPARGSALNPPQSHGEEVALPSELY